MNPEQTAKTRTTEEIVDGYNDCKMFYTRKWILESDYKAKIKEIREIIEECIKKSYERNRFNERYFWIEFDKLTQGDE